MTTDEQAKLQRAICDFIRDADDELTQAAITAVHDGCALMRKHEMDIVKGTLAAAVHNKTIWHALCQLRQVAEATEEP